MAWKNDQEPSKPTQPGKPKSDGPPDLEALLKKLFRFGGKRPTLKSITPASDAPKKNPLTGFSWGWVYAGVAVAVGVWGLSGIYVVQPAQEGALLTFGRYVKTVGPGMHWYPRLIDRVVVQNVDQQQAISLSASMLTRGENIVQVEFSVQYKIGNLQDYLFNVENPNYSLKEILESAVRQTMGTSNLEDILTTGRAAATAKVEETMQQLVSKYQLGLQIVDVKMLAAAPPTEVKAAFDDVIKAREDNQRFQNEAETYANSIVPIAQGKAARVLQQARAYQQQQIYVAQGAVAKFDALLPIYESQKQITQTRLYFDTMTAVLSHTRVAVIDSGNKGGSMFYVPLNNIMSNTAAGTSGATRQAVQATDPEEASGASSGAWVQQAVNAVDAKERGLLSNESQTFQKSVVGSASITGSPSSPSGQSSNPFGSSSSW